VSALSIGHADDLGGEWPEIELLADFGAFGFAGRFIGDFFSLAEQVFPLCLVIIFQRQRGSLDVKNMVAMSVASFLEELGLLAIKS